jgi:hypothetical protein
MCTDKNNIVDLIVTVDVGPRIIRYGFGGQEMNCVVESTMGQEGETNGRFTRSSFGIVLKIRRTYEPDNEPVAWEEIANGIRTKQNIEPGNGSEGNGDITFL